jgi:hypothetical protein
MLKHELSWHFYLALLCIGKIEFVLRDFRKDYYQIGCLQVSL